MQMQQHLKTIGLIAFFFVVFDGIVLSSLRSFFDKQIIQVQGSPISLNPVAAVICYFVLVTGLYYFIVLPGKPLLDAFLLGLLIYATFETTNKAMLKKWNWLTVMIDSTWGGILFTLTTGVVYWITGKRISYF
jgi:uncharacterized membrane protein